MGSKVFLDEIKGIPFNALKEQILVANGADVLKVLFIAPHVEDIRLTGWTDFPLISIQDNSHLEVEIGGKKETKIGLLLDANDPQFKEITGQIYRDDTLIIRVLPINTHQAEEALGKAVSGVYEAFKSHALEAVGAVYPDYSTPGGVASSIIINNTSIRLLGTEETRRGLEDKIIKAIATTPGMKEVKESSSTKIEDRESKIGL